MKSLFKKRKKRSDRSRYKKRNKSLLRLSVSRKNANFYAQIIDDSSASTLYHISTLSKNFDRGSGHILDSSVVSRLGDFFSQNIPEPLKGSKVVFDCGFRSYHGLVAIFAQKARSCLIF